MFSNSSAFCDSIFNIFFVILGTNTLGYHHTSSFVRIIHEKYLSKCRIFISFSMNIAKLCSTFLFLDFLSSVVIIIIIIIVVVVVANRTCEVGAPVDIMT